MEIVHVLKHPGVYYWVQKTCFAISTNANTMMTSEQNPKTRLAFKTMVFQL